MRAYGWGNPTWRNPITGIPGCCARAASGHTTAAPPRSAMNFRRFTPSPHQSRWVRISVLAHSGELDCCVATGWAERGPLCVISRHMHRGKENLYSTTASARATIDGGTARPSTFAVLRLMTNSTVVDRSTGRSAGFTPPRILPTKPAARLAFSLRFGP